MSDQQSNKHSFRAMGSYLRVVLRRTFAEVWETIGFNRQTLFAILVYLVLLSLFWFREGGGAVMNEIGTWLKLVALPTLIAVVILLVLMAIKAAQLIHSEQTEALSDQRELNKPKLSISFDRTNPNCIDLNYVPSGQRQVVSTYRVFRVGIKNIGGYRLSGVEAKADYEWEGRSFSAIPLHQMHDANWLLHGTSLNPDETLYVDVVMMKESAQDAKFSPKQTEIRLCHLKPNVVRSEIGRGRHRIPIVAYASETPPERRIFVAWVDDWNRLHFEEETDQADSSQNVGSIPSS